MQPTGHRVLEIFEEINRIPRCSRREERICTWLQGWARDLGLPASGDSAGNLVVRVPAAGNGRGPTVILQAHVDMVCEKTPDSDHDFTTDPIRHVVDGHWLRADGTTLGADNGIGMALAMTVAETPDLHHPPLELLFTVDEETGLNGAKLFDPGSIRGRVLLNIDSEQEGLFVVGCAGGSNAEAALPLSREAPLSGTRTAILSTAGMRGGHSGIDISEGRANALKILATVLAATLREADLRIIDIRGGSAHNVIPREAEARVAGTSDQIEKARQIVAGLQDTLRKAYAHSDPDLRIHVDREAAAALEPGRYVLTAASARAAVDLLTAMPDGVHAMSTDFEDLVQTSSNMARVETAVGEMNVLTSLRSARNPDLEALTDQIRSLTASAGARLTVSDGYPPWEPDLESELLARSRRVYRRVFGSDPEVRALHAGLECAVLGAGHPGMQMISLGPTIRNPHSPAECLHLPSVDRVWKLLVELLNDYGR